MAIRDGVDVGVLGVLRGGTLNSAKAYAENLANVFLGSAIGAHIDLGKTDEEIIKTCQELLSRTRAAMANVVIRERYTEIVSDMKKL